MAEQTAVLRANVRTHEDALALARRELGEKSLLGCVPALMPGYERPEHLAPLADVYERAFLAAEGKGPPVFALVSAPSQVGKTSLGQVAAARWLARRPQDWFALLMYGQDIANAKSKAVRGLCRELGVELRDDTTAADMWATSAGGGYLARGLAAGVTGQSGVKVLVIDDPYRNRAQAESALEREKIHADVRASVFTRRHPDTSVIINHTRFVVPDLIGELHEKHGELFEYHCVPAVGEDGTPVVTMRGRDAAYWATQRQLMGEYDWWSLMQGRPRPRGGALFRGVTFYDVLPSHLRVSIGVDFAYSSKTRSDWSVAVVLGRGDDDRLYVLRVVRRQCAATEFVGELQALTSSYPGAPFHAYIGGTERGIVDFVGNAGVRINAKPATEDKHTRAQPTVADWNRGVIVVPRDATWLDAFTSVVLDFTGTGKDRHDDDVDALVAARDGVAARVDAGDFATVVPSHSASLGLPRSHRGGRGPW